MTCTKCNAENPADKKFCGDCGAALASQTAVAVPGDLGAFYCYKHKKEVTRVRCGRCETPLCPRCMVHSPAGVRCRDCSRNRVPVRPMGVINNVGRTMDSGSGRVIWYMVIWLFIVNLFGGFGGNRDA